MSHILPVPSLAYTTDQTKMCRHSIDTTLYPSKFDLVFKSTWRYLPEPILHLFRYLPGREYTRFRHYLDFVRNTAREVVEKSEETGNGKDIISILRKANRSENPKTKLSDWEVVDQVCEYNFRFSLPFRLLRFMEEIH